MAITYHAGRRIQGIAGVDVADTHTSTATPSGTYSITLGGGSGSGATRCGLQVHTGHFLIDKGLKTIKFNMDRYGSVSGTGHAQVYDSSGNTKGSISSTYSLSGLPAYPVSTNGVTFTWTTPVVIANGDRIMVEGGNFNTSNQVDFYGVNTTPDSNINPIGYNSGTWTAQSGADTYFVATTETNNGDTKPSNVQLGSRFEETDTRKMYNYTESDTISSTPASWGDFSSTTGSQNLSSGGYQISAQKIHNSSSNLDGKTIGKIGLPIRLISGTGTATAGVFNSSGNILHTFGTIDISTLSSSYTPYTWYDFTGTSLYTLDVGEYVGIKMTSGSGEIGVAHRDSGTQYDGGNSYWDRWNGSSWSNSFTSIDQSIKLYVGTTGGTFTWQEIGT